MFRLKFEMDFYFHALTGITIGGRTQTLVITLYNESTYWPTNQCEVGCVEIEDGSNFIYVQPRDALDISKTFRIMLFLDGGIDFDSLPITEFGPQTVGWDIVLAQGSSVIDEFMVSTVAFGAAMTISLSPIEHLEQGVTKEHTMSASVNSITSSVGTSTFEFFDQFNQHLVTCEKDVKGCIFSIKFQSKPDHILMQLDQRQRSIGELISFIGAAWSSAFMVIWIMFRKFDDPSGNIVMEPRVSKKTAVNLIHKARSKSLSIRSHAQVETKRSSVSEAPAKAPV
jgi:hypothetical protein